MSDRDVNRALAVLAGLVILSGPRRTRPLAGFLYGLLLSRAQGASRRRLEATLLGLFDQRQSVTARVDELDRRINAWVGTLGPVNGRLDVVERFLGGETLLANETRLLELGPVRRPGTMDLEPAELERIAEHRAELKRRREAGGRPRQLRGEERL